MANRDSIQIALKVIEQINTTTIILRRAAENVTGILNSIESFTADNDKKDILIEGLQALDINLADLNSDKNTIKSTATGVLNNIPELTEL